MTIELLLMLLGGLALFLYGMQMMSSNLEAVAGNRMKDILEKLTSNRFLGVFAGAVITAVIQSSSATTVMVVGFVNSGLMSLNQAVWIIMGANIGTTITGQLIALDISVIAPFIAFIGVMLITFIKNKKAKYVGGIIAGLGILFIGMGMMSDSMMPLRDSEVFINFMTNFKNPLLGILVGALFTAIIQSSSASVDDERFDQTGRRCIYTLWPKYRYLYYCCTCFYRNKPECKTDNYYSSFVQHHRNLYFCHDLHADPIHFFYAEFDTGQSGSTDCQYTYYFQYHYNVTSASIRHFTCQGSYSHFAG